MKKLSRIIKIALIGALLVCFLSVGLCSAQETVGLTEPQTANFLTFGVLFALLVICIILTLKPNVPILNFVFGVMSFGIAASTAGQTTLLFYGYIQMLVIVIALLCMYSGYKNYG